jgi:hypothetical protein
MKTDSHIMKNISGAYIESENLSDTSKIDIKVSAKRATQALNLNINFQLPTGVDPNTVDQKLLQQWHLIIQRLVMEEIRNQSDVIGYESRPSRTIWEREEWRK